MPAKLTSISTDQKPSIIEIIWPQAHHPSGLHCGKGPANRLARLRVSPQIPLKASAGLNRATRLLKLWRCRNLCAKPLPRSSSSTTLRTYSANAREIGQIRKRWRGTLLWTRAMMNDPENPLARWSRRKSDARTGRPGESATGDESAAAESNASAPGDDQHPFDPEGLPPIEAIDGKTDLRVLLAQGVPAELMRAALRRGWSSDPVIRDFIGLSENSWDFNASDGISGFGSLAPEDIQRLARAFEGAGAIGEAVPMSAAATSSNEMAQTAECTPALEQLQTKSDSQGSDSQEKPPSDLAQQHHAGSAHAARADGAAIPTERSAQGLNLQRSSRRRHGGTLPRIGSR
jgi:hypothetical protein